VESGCMYVVLQCSSVVWCAVWFRAYAVPCAMLPCWTEMELGCE